MECEILPNLIATNTRTQHEIKMPFGKESSMLVDGIFMNEFDTMEAIEYVDLNNVDVEEYGYQILLLLGLYDRDIYGREVYKTEKVFDSLDEESTEQDVDSI